MKTTRKMGAVLSYRVDFIVQRKIFIFQNPNQAKQLQSSQSLVLCPLIVVMMAALDAITQESHKAYRRATMYNYRKYY